MHILFLSHYFPPEVNATAGRTYDHAVRWAKQPGVTVTVITNHPSHPRGKIFPGHRNRALTRENVDGIEVFRVKGLFAANAGRLRRMLSFLFFVLAIWPAVLRAGRPDLVVATSPQLLCALAGLLTAWFKRRPFVMEVCDIWPESIVSVGVMQDGVFIRLLEMLEMLLYRHAALIITATQGIKGVLMQRGIDARKIVAVTNGVDLERFRPEPIPAEIKQRIGAGDKFLASYIGTVGLAHGLEVLIDAARLLRDQIHIQLLVVGDGAAWQALADGAASLDNLHVLPAVSKEEVKYYYAASDVCLVLIKKEPLFQASIPSKVFELMAMSRPIIHSVPGGEFERLIADAGCGVMVEPEDAQGLADSIMRMAEEPERRAAMGRAGRVYVTAHYTRDHLAARYLAALRKVVRP